MIVMSIVVRDEADIIGHNIEYHRRMGVDRFVVIDHRSVDGTSEILERFRRRGFVSVIHKSEEIYKVREWTNDLMRTARKRHGHTWHIPNDADEFYLPPAGHTLKSYLATQMAHRVLQVPRTNVIFSQEELALHGWRGAQGYASTITQLYDASIADPNVRMAAPWLYCATIGKATFQPATCKSITKGSHRAIMNPRVDAVPCEMRILHFAARSEDEVVRAAIRLGQSAEEIDTAENISAHYRRWVRMAKAGVPTGVIYDENLPRQDRLALDVATGVLVPITYPEALRQVLEMDSSEIAPPKSLWSRLRHRLASIAARKRH